jgi:hypothetical protein
MFSRKNFCVVSTSKEQFLGGKLNNAGEKWHHFDKAERARCERRREASNARGNGDWQG